MTIKGFVDRHQPPQRGNASAPYRVFIHDDTGELALTYFRVKGNWLEKALPVGEDVIVSGKVNWFNGRPSMVHPDYAAKVEDLEKLPLVEPVYPLTAGLSPKALRKAVEAAVERLPDLPSGLMHLSQPSTASPRSRRASRGCTIRAMLPISICRPRRGEGLPMTNFSPDRSRWRWSGKGCARRPAFPFMRRVNSPPASARPCPFC